MRREAKRFDAARQKIQNAESSKKQKWQTSQLSRSVEKTRVCQLAARIFWVSILSGDVVVRAKKRTDRGALSTRGTGGSGAIDAVSRRGSALESRYERSCRS